MKHGDAHINCVNLLIDMYRICNEVLHYDKIHAISSELPNQPNLIFGNFRIEVTLFVLHRYYSAFKYLIASNFSEKLNRICCGLNWTCWIKFLFFLTIHFKEVCI